MNKKLLLLLVPSFFIMISCDVSYLDKPIDEDVQLEIAAQFPLGHLTYSISELFEELDANGFEVSSYEELKFSYSETFSGNDDSAFDLKTLEREITNTIPTPIMDDDIYPLNFPLTLTSVPEELNKKTITHQLVHDLNQDQELTKIYFSAGQMQIIFTSSFDAKISLILEIPSLINKENGIIFSKPFIMNGDSTSTLNINLDDYYVDLTHNGKLLNSTNNRLVFNLYANFFFSAGNVLKSDDTISYDVSFLNTETAVIHGDFKQEPFSISNKTIPLNFFDVYGDSNISFSNPKITIAAVSDYGFPIGADLSGITAIKNSGAKKLYYKGDNSLENFIIIDGVEKYGDEERLTTRILTNENSNIHQILEEKPIELELNVNALSNPIDYNPNDNFYAYPNNGLTIDLTIDFEAVNLTKGVDYNFDENLDDLTQMELLVTVQNKIPLSGDIVLSFKNTSHQTIHSETLNVFQAANVTETGESDGIPKFSKFNINLDKNEIQHISNASYVDVKLTLALPNGEKRVLVRESDDITIYISSIINGSISTNKN